MATALLLLVSGLVSAAPASAASLPTAPLVTWVIASGSAATLHWAPPRDSGTLEGILTYRIDYTSDGGTSWAMVTLSTGSSLTGWGTADISFPLDPEAYVLGTSYQFRVAAINSVGTGPWSTASGNYIRSGLPTEPVLSAVVTPGNSQASLQWCCSSGQGSAITGYSIRASVDAGATWGVGPANTGSTAMSGTVTGLTNGRSYVFQVAAINANGTGTWSATSNAATPTGPPDAVTWGTATAGASQVQLTWAAPANNGGSALTAYSIQSSTNGGSTWSAPVPNTGNTSTSATITGLSNGTAYVFRVAALSALGTGAWSSSSAPVTPTPASAPSGTPPATTPPPSTPGSSTTTPVATASCPASRSLGRGVTLVSWPGCGVTASRLAVRPASRSAARARTVRTLINRVVVVNIRKLPRSQPMTVGMRIGGSWVAVGTAISTSRGTLTRPAFSASRAGRYPIELTTTSGVRYYVTVIVARSG
ncbi:MAG: fibronectin type III domain-containing protein [Actinomycetes bacterium]